VSEVTEWKDLEHFGIIMLTGESCGLGMRLLCDLNTRGVLIINEFLGGNVTFKKDSNWNNGAVASILLPRSILQDLAAFCLLKENKIVVVCPGGDVVGMDEKEFEWRNQVTGWRESLLHVYQKHGTASDGMRNQHRFTGRIT
jgi:hypothetical protein